MFDDIYREFLVDDDPDLSRADWQRLFQSRPDTGQDHAGYALVDGSTIGGVLGMTFSQRRLGDQDHKVCALHTWMVKPEFRGSSLRLMRPAMKLTDHTVCDFTPTAPVRKLSRRLGFSDMDSSLRVLLPFTGLKKSADAIDILTDTDQIRSLLSADDAQLLDDHQADHFGHALYSIGTCQCYVIYSRVTRWRLPYCHVHYISDLPAFAENSLTIRRHIGRTERTRLVVLYNRQVADHKLPYSFRFAQTNGQLYRPAAATPDQIDNLYSDVAQLNLTTINSLSSMVKERFNRE